MIKKDGVTPKPPSKRRRTNKPASYGLAEPIQAGRAAKQPDLGFDAHFLVTDLWKALEESVEGRFFSAADWERARAELWYMNHILGQEIVSPASWQRVQNGLSEMLVSPADKRRVGIELKAAVEDPDEVAAVGIMAGYQEKLAGVMCAQNPRNCALRDGHDGLCLPALELNKRVERGIEELMSELEASQQS